jgi:hypothetical protein
MSEFEQRSYHPVGQTTTPTQDAKGASYAGPNRGASPNPSPKRKLALKLLPWALGLVVLCAILGYFAASAPKNGKTGLGSALGSSSDGATGTSLAKPAAGKPFAQAPKTPPPITVPRSSPPVVPQNSSTLVIPPGPAIPQQNPAPPPPPVATGMPPAPAATTTPFAPVVYPARHDKHFGESCSGQLSLNSSGLAFSCPDDPHGGVQVAINEIASVDENGIRLTSGKKYHFSIPGMSKSSEEKLFTDWLSRVR